MPAPQPEPGYEYSVIIDAGSSGSRLFIYKWKTDFGTKPPNIEIVWPVPGKKAEKELAEVNGGLDEQSRGKMGMYFRKMVNGAKNKVPVHTQLYLLATGGMRRLEKTRQDEILIAAHTALREEAGDAFTINIKNVRIAEGVDEAIYAWVAWNHGSRGMVLTGVLELGGASMQVAFPRAAEALDTKKVCLKVGAVEVDNHVYGQTWDGYGVGDMRKKYKEILINLQPVNGVDLSDPCLPRDQLGIPFFKDGVMYNFRGTGNPTICQRIVTPMFRDLNPKMPRYRDINFPENPRSPSGRGSFVIGVGNYWYTYDYFSKKSDGETPNYEITKSWDMEKFKDAVHERCSSPVPTTGPNSKIADARCFNAALIISGLVNEDGLDMGMGDRIHGKGLLIPTEPKLRRASWTVGAAVLIANHGHLDHDYPDYDPLKRHYCRVAPALDGALAIGASTANASFTLDEGAPDPAPAANIPFTLDEGALDPAPAANISFILNEDAPVPAPSSSIPLYHLYIPIVLVLLILTKLFTWYRGRRSPSGAIMLVAEKDHDGFPVGISGPRIALPADEKLLSAARHPAPSQV